MLYVFDHKTWYILIHAPHTPIVVFWDIGNIPPRVSYSQICYNTPMPDAKNTPMSNELM